MLRLTLWQSVLELAAQTTEICHNTEIQLYTKYALVTGYMFILKNIITEKWSSEKSLSSLIRSVIQLPSFDDLPISAVPFFQHSLPKIRKIQHALTVKIIV